MSFQGFPGSDLLPTRGTGIEEGIREVSAFYMVPDVVLGAVREDIADTAHVPRLLLHNKLLQL